MKPADTRKNAEHRWIIDSIEESVASIEVDGDRTITVPSTRPAPGAFIETLVSATTPAGHGFRIERLDFRPLRALDR